MLLVPQAGIEPTTLALGVLCSVHLSYWGNQEIIPNYGSSLTIMVPKATFGVLVRTWSLCYNHFAHSSKEPV